jgi:hypothetical protein
MERVRDVAKLGMITTVTVERRSEADPPAGGDYGDDFLDYTITSESRRLTLKGWFHSTPTTIQEVDTGAIVTANTYRLFVPVGTDILPGDLVYVGAEEYVVSDTTQEGSWLPLLTANLRRRE